MRNQSPIDALFPKTRQVILAAVLMQPERSWYLSDLARHLGLRPSSLQRELAALVRAGILHRRQDGNRVYFQADLDCPFFSELQGILAKTCGLMDILRQALKRFSRRIDVAFVFGSIARSAERSASDIDLLIVGDIGLADVSSALRRAERRLGRPVNVSIYTSRELAKKVKAGHHFLRAILDQEKLFVLGNDDELAELARGQPSRAAHRDATRTERS